MSRHIVVWRAEGWPCTTGGEMADRRERATADDQAAAEWIGSKLANETW
jgi:hypothetical protein